MVVLVKDKNGIFVVVEEYVLTHFFYLQSSMHAWKLGKVKTWRVFLSSVLFSKVSIYKLNRF